MTEHPDAMPPVDLVERLRAHATPEFIITGPLFAEAITEIERLRTWFIRLHNGGLDTAMRRRVVFILDGQPAIKLPRDDDALAYHRQWLKAHDRYEEFTP